MKKRLIACMLVVTVAILSSCADKDMLNHPDASANSTEELKTEENTVKEPSSEPNITEADQTDNTEPPSVSTDEITTEPVTSSEPVFQMPDQSYVGVWSDQVEEGYINKIYIYEITPEHVKFEVYFVRLFGVYGTATEENGEFVFVDINDSDMKGKLIFEEDGVTVMFDSYGHWEEYKSITSERSHKFMYKDPRSDEIIKNIKENGYVNW